jgi:hypothetical protein
LPVNDLILSSVSLSFCLFSFFTTISAIWSIMLTFFRFFDCLNFPNPVCSDEVWKLGVADVSESEDVSEESSPRPVWP